MPPEHHRLADRQEISELLIEYCRALDVMDLPAIARVFTEDCAVEYGPEDRLRSKGAAGVAKSLERMWRWARTSHHLSNIQIAFDGEDRARSISYVLAWHERPDGSTATVMGQYHDRLVRTEKGWRIANRRMDMNGSDAGFTVNLHRTKRQGPPAGWVAPNIDAPRQETMNLAGLLDGKTAFVTGGAAGLGLAIVTGFAAAGAKGTAFDRRKPARDLPKGWCFSAGDVRQEASLAEGLARMNKDHGRLDLLVANAGVVPAWRESESIDLGEWDEAFAVNARGVMATIKQAIPLMKSRGGSVIVMASVNAMIGHARQAAYVASKHAVLGIARAAAQDLGRYGIRVNALCPGPIATGALLERLHERAKGGGPPEKEIMEQYSRTALGRIATADEVAHAALFLASDLSSGITGQAITVDAGAN